MSRLVKYGAILVYIAKCISLVENYDFHVLYLNFKWIVLGVNGRYLKVVTARLETRSYQDFKSKSNLVENHALEIRLWSSLVMRMSFQVSLHFIQ